ncbi:TetR family transcriptional regulator [Nocardioides marmoribigeumensis]|uniref:AcrR family transcriptional regulator n=1 Tax=Nocardioides marmoribigeumensis TaxID=433649 RepID=A0ABU2BVR2_9ACTN|nr:TetR family transcriptional regulator [Nocardioides marmoribigeumensis]MDR7362731.1 AcrR family transcriptional regulator [Nocardioides marmoribigeumensis]
MTTAPTRSERKEATRRAILDAALALSAETGLAGLSLRSVAKEVGIVPTAFYRHFASIEELGVALVGESFASLRQVLRDLRREMQIDRVIADSVAILARHTLERREHFLFIGRERVGGLVVVQDAIRHELGLFERELAMDVARLPGVEEWSSEDLQALANLIVKSMVETAVELITLPPHRPDLRARVVATAETQLRMVVIGGINWRSTRPD